MSLRPIYLYGSHVLREQAKPVKDLTDEVITLIADMVQTMHAAGGIGLAANQVGELHRVLVVDLGAVEEALREEREGAGAVSRPASPQVQTLVVINPEILQADGSWKMEEGCLSIPGVRANVERAETIRIRFRDGHFQQRELDADGLLARVLLHEVDHLNGVLFIDHLSAAQRSLLKPRLRKIKQGEVDTSYPVVAERIRRRSGVEV
jgi:peptide deformylase